jgi:aspartate aminotransferase-like enzyme
MNDIQALLRFVFQTKNRFTIAVSGTGSAGMEASIVNIVEPGDAVIVGINGLFGTRLATIVERCGGKAIRVEPLGTDHWQTPLNSVTPIRPGESRGHRTCRNLDRRLAAA